VQRASTFAAVAAAIGLAEEVAYRGFVQDAFRKWGILIAAVAHTAYKISLFALPGGNAQANLWVLAVGTLLGGLLLGWAKARGAGLAFPMAAHAVFDIVAYGDLTSAPWWI
jgi:membrane protease YdiL (CAAX protease family)